MLVKEYGKDYLIYSDGRVFSKKINRFQKPRKHSNGYLRCTIYGKDKYIHRVVGECFLEKRECFYEINHIDGDKTNNNVENLEWTNRAGNNKHCFDIGLRTSEEMRKMSMSEGAIASRRRRRMFTDKQALEIIDLINYGFGDTYISRKYNCNRGVIYSIRVKKSYKEIRRWS